MDRTEDLALRARAGDQAAYEALFARVAERVLVYVRCRLGPQLRARVDPWDVLQETYLEAHRSLARFQGGGEGAFSAWLYRIAENRLRDLAGRWSTQKRQAAGGEVHATDVVSRLRAQETGPSTGCARQEENERLVQAIDQLEPQEREALLLRFFQGRTLEEIASALATSERSVRRLLGQAQVKLGGLLERGGPG